MPGRRVQCDDCSDILQSQHRHDWVQCTCGNIFIDGGGDYTRIGSRNAHWHYLEDEDELARHDG